LELINNSKADSVEESRRHLGSAEAIHQKYLENFNKFGQQLEKLKEDLNSETPIN